MNAASPTNGPVQSPAVIYAAVAVWAFVNCLVQPSFAVETNIFAKNTATYRAALNSITVDDLNKHVCYLADDKLQGRKPGTKGGRAAGNHIAEEFKKFQLSPGDIPLNIIPPNGDGDIPLNTEGDYFQPFQAIHRNVLALLPGSDADLKKEVIVVGAHYDHLGRDAEVYNGADDNASGTAGLLELAEAFAMLPQPPRRTLLFAAWDGEETGLRGSRHWLRHASLGDGRIVFMLNMDMIGRLRDNKLAVRACRSGYGLRRLVSTLNSDLTLEFPRKIKRRGDHWTFYNAGIPVMMFHTGPHDELHTPDDDVELINNEGMCRVARLAFEIISALVDADEITKFRAASHDDRPKAVESGAGQLAACVLGRFGATWQTVGDQNNKISLDDVYLETPADRASLEPGDRVVSFAGRTINSPEDMQSAVLTAAGPAKIVVRRDGRADPLSLSVDLVGKPLRLGIFWREDDAEPGTAVLTHVVPKTPAARAGLESGDRIYRVGGKKFDSGKELSKRLATPKGPIRFRVERAGKLREVEVWPKDALMKQAA